MSASNTTMNHAIRLAEPKDDAPAIRAIYAPFVTETAITFEYDPPTVQTMRQRLELLMESYPCLVATDDAGQVVGYAYADALRGKQAYQWAVETTIYLAAEARGQGLGRALYQTLLDTLARQGRVWAYACLTAPHGASAAFHQRLGFEYLARFPQAGFKLAQWWAIDWYRKALRPVPAAPDPPTPLGEIWHNGFFHKPPAREEGSTDG
jgi:phosphinothricin acetyltransferase